MGNVSNAKSGVRPIPAANHCYVAIRNGEPGAYAACVDMSDMRKETGKFVRDIIKKGDIVQHVTVERAREMLMEWHHAAEARRAAKSAGQSQDQARLV